LGRIVAALSGGMRRFYVKIFAATALLAMRAVGRLRFFVGLKPSSE
jgi:hypothetical protein